jgi:hypothetical protein
LTILREVFHINGVEDVSQVAVGPAEDLLDEGETAVRTRLADGILPVKDALGLPFVVPNLTTSLVNGCTAPILRTISKASRGIDLHLVIRQSP